MTDDRRISRRGVVAVIRRADRLLVIRRSDQVLAPGMICFPGGGIEPGETPQQALIRELQEELGVAVEPIRPLWQTVTSWRVSLTWWLTDLPEDAAVRPNPAEVASAHWLTAEDIAGLPDLLEGNDQFIDRVVAGSIVLSRNS